MSVILTVFDGEYVFLVFVANRKGAKTKQNINHMIPTPLARHLELFCLSATVLECGLTSLTYIHYITLQYITLQYSTLYYIKSNYITLQYITLHTYVHTHVHTYIPYHTIPDQTIPYHTIILHYISFHFITFHYIT